MLAKDTMNVPAAINAHERLTWDEICRRFPDEWVVIAEMDWVEDGCFEFGTAIVFAHHKTRKEASSSVKTADEQYDEVGAFFTGRLLPPMPSINLALEAWRLRGADPVGREAEASSGDSRSEQPEIVEPATVVHVPERLTWDEICRRYPDIWVVAVDSKRIDETDEADEVGIEFRTALVIAHHKNRKCLSAFIKAEQHRYEDLGAYFTGRRIAPAYKLLVP